jgi:hypothetical protein
MNRIPLIATSFALLLTSGGAVLAQNSITLNGTVKTGSTPISGSTVTLYQAGNASGETATALASVQSGSDGTFELNYVQPAPADMLYLVASGGTPETGNQSLLGDSCTPGCTRLAALLGQTSEAPANAVINELTTIAIAWSMAQFMDGGTIAGKPVGLRVAAATCANLVDVTTGEVAAKLANPPNGSATSLDKFNTLANILAVCVSAETDAPCNELFSLSTTASGEVPTDTLQAALNIAHNPVNNTQGLFLLSLANQTYTPSLEQEPQAWEIFLKHIGNGEEFDGPGNMAFDKDGNLYITNNFVLNSDPGSPGQCLLALDPGGNDLPGAPFCGGGISGAGYGIGIDTRGFVWVGNFGFGQPGSFGDDISAFDPDVGIFLSPDRGITLGNISGPQGTVSDQEGNIWIANLGNSTVTKYPNGNPRRAVNFSGRGFDRPFDIAIDRHRNAWVSSSGNHRLVGLAPDGTPLPGSPFSGGGLRRPWGIAIDSLGNKWVSNLLGNSVSWFRPDGTPYPASPFTANDTIFGPFGIAIDGNDNVYVPNFLGQNLTILCGANSEHWPPGFKTGDPLSPPGGYTSKVLERLTSAEIDPAGNVWVANNFKSQSAAPPNPGGDSMLQFVGLAAPIDTPLIGPPAPSDRFIIEADPTSVTPGATIAVSWYFTNMFQNVDAYFGVETPGGNLFLMNEDGVFQSAIVPIASNIDVSGNPSGVLMLVVPAGEEAGAYTLKAVAVPTGASVTNPYSWLGDGIVSVEVTVD